MTASLGTWYLPALACWRWALWMQCLECIAGASKFVTPQQGAAIHRHLGGTYLYSRMNGGPYSASACLVAGLCLSARQLLDQGQSSQLLGGEQDHSLTSRQP